MNNPQNNQYIDGETIDQETNHYLELAGDWAFRLNLEGTILFCHKSASATHPAIPVDLVGKPFSVFLPENQVKKIYDLMGSCKQVDGITRRTTFIDDNGCHIELDVISTGSTGYQLLMRNLSQRLGTDWRQGDRVELTEKAEVLTHEEALQLQLRQQELVAAMAINLSGVTDYSVAFNQALKQVGEFLDADRVYLFRDDAADSVFYCTYQWSSPHVEPMIATTQVVPYDSQHDSYLQLLTLPFIAINDTRLLPSGQREKSKEIGIKSFIHQPVWVGGRFWGFLGIDSCRKKRRWSISEITLVQTIGGILSAAIQKKQMEAAMSAAYHKLDGIVRNYPGAIWCLDTDYNLTLCEGMALPSLGLDAAVITGRNLADLGPAAEEFFSYARTTFEEGTPQTYVLPRLGRYMACNTNLLRNASGKVVGQVGVAQDITEMRTMQTKLELAIDEAEKASKAKSEFLSRMSHEIRTPMNAIIGMNSIARKTDDTVKIQYCLEKIENASKQLLTLINDILDMSKIEANKFELSDNEFDFEKMLQNVNNVVNVRIEEKHQQFVVDFDDMFLSNVVCDELRLSQVMINLLTNAVKFTPENGKITLKIRHAPIDDIRSRLHVEVVDTGIGISQEAAKRLFQSFEQADGSTTRRFGGTGLGLAICKKITTLMGGDIWVESTEGVGSSFIFEVDIKWGSDIMQFPMESGLNKEKIRILVVDDSEEVRVYFSNTLHNFALRCETASSGQEGIDKVKKAIDDGDPYNIIFMDLQMPGIGGMEASRAIKAIVNDSAILIMISVADWSEIETEAVQSGISRFLPKPVMPSVLFNTIMETMEYSVFTENVQYAQPSFQWQDKNILLAEDIEINREIILSILNETGVTVDCAVNGKEAVDKYTVDPIRYDLVLMDIQMPELDGFEATQQIRNSNLATSRSIPIIAMTANAFREDVEKCLAIGMNDHIAKPIDLDELMGKLDYYLNL